MMAKIRGLFDTQKRNARFKHYPATALDPLETPVTVVEVFQKARTEIDSSRNLTAEGKAVERAKARKTSLDAVDTWLSTRLAGLDADLAARRAALAPTIDPPDPRRLDVLLSYLRDRTPEEIAVLYNSATDEERRVMEAASASVGRVPMKTGWRPLLDPQSVNESILARAAATNPEGAQQVQELTELRAMTITLAGNAVAEINEG